MELIWEVFYAYIEVTSSSVLRLCSATDQLIKIWCCFTKYICHREQLNKNNFWPNDSAKISDSSQENHHKMFYYNFLFNLPLISTVKNTKLIFFYIKYDENIMSQLRPISLYIGNTIFCTNPKDRNSVLNIRRQQKCVATY